MRFRATFTFPAALVLGLAIGGSGAEPHRDPKAVGIADALEKAIAPDGAWQKLRGLRFTFTVVKNGETQAEFHHTWDLKTGQYRVQGLAEDGNQRCIIFDDIWTKKGKAWFTLHAPIALPEPGQDAPSPESGLARWVQFPGPPLKHVLEWGYERFINDTYWLLMPLKMKDSGVNLDYEGEKKVDGEDCDVVKMTFEGVGLTPGDTYWVYVNRKNHLIDRWEYVLQAREGGEKASERSTWLWKNWQRFGPLRLSTEKTLPDGHTSITFKDVEALTEIPADAFEPPLKKR